MTPVGNSRVIEIRYEDASPVLAATVANAVADTFVDDRGASQGRASRRTADWLQAEINRLEDRVAEADRKLERHRSGRAIREIITGSSSNGQSQQELNLLNIEIAQARSEKAQADARAVIIRKALENEASMGAAREIVDSPLIRSLREQQVRLRTQEAELSLTYLPDHPRIEALLSQIADLDRQIRGEITKVLKSMELTAEIAAARVSSLEASLQELTSAIPPVIADESELKALEYDARSQRELLEAFMARMRTLNAADGPSAGLPGARIISRAKIPDGPSSPNRWLWTILGALAGLSVMLASYFKQRRGQFDPHADDEENSDIVDDVLQFIQHPGIDEPEQSELSVDQPPVLDDALDDGLGEPLSQSEEEILGAEEVISEAEDVDSPNEEEVISAPDVHSGATAGQDISEDPVQVGERPVPTSVDKHEKNIGQRLAEAPGTKALADMLGQDGIKTVLFSGSHDTRPHGALALAVASTAVSGSAKAIVVDIGCRRSELVSPDDERPGLGELMSGLASFGQVIRRDVLPDVDAIGMGRARGNPPLKRLMTTIANLASRYSRVIVIADQIEDWPDRFIRPDLAIIAYRPGMDAEDKRLLYEHILRRGAGQVVLVRDEFSEITAATQRAA